MDITWDESKPPDTEEASLGDDRIRSTRKAVRERAAVQHQAYADESGHDDVWEHIPGECTVLFVGTKVNFPTPATTTKGCMAIATDESNEIYYWNGTAWAKTGVVLTGGEAQTVAGVKTFSDIPVFSKGLAANNAYLQARNAAGSGNVDLIKANASDVAVIPAGSELASSAAPTADADIANKKYVDDQDTADHPAYSGGESHTDGSGLIIKMGKKSVGANSSATVTFASAFPTACSYAFVSRSDSTDSVGECAQVTITDKTAISVYNASNSTSNVSWFAIGY